MSPDTQPRPPFSASDVDEIRERLLDGESSRHLAEEYSTRERVLLRAARGVLGYTHDASHPPVNYDPDAGEWFVPEENQQDPDPSPYTIEGELLWVPEWQIQPWAREDGEDAVDEDTEGRESKSESEATTTTMTNTTTPDSDTDTDASSTGQTQTTISNGNGETIAGTSADDWGEIKTEAWPSHIDPEDVTTPLRREIIQAAAMHREWDRSQIADYLGCTKEYVSMALKRHWPGHHICNSQQAPVLFLDDVSEIRKRLVAGESTRDLKKAYNVAQPTIRHAAKGMGAYTNVVDCPPVVYDKASRQWEVLENDDTSTGTDERDGTLPENESSSDSPQLTLPSSIDLDDLTHDLEKRILSVALEHPDWGQPEIADGVGCPSYEVSEMFRVYWPTHPSVQSAERDGPVTTTDVDEIRNRLLNGDTLSDIARDIELSNGCVSSLAKGEYSIADAANVPPVIHDQSAGGWIIADSENRSDTVDNSDQDIGVGDSTDSENDRSEEWTDEPALTADEVDEIRERLVAGESAGTLAVDYNTKRDIISEAAKGQRSYSRNTSHPPVEYDRSTTEWVIAEDGDNPEAEDSLDSNTDTTSSSQELVALEYGADIYHHLDNEDDICCGLSGDDDSLIRLERDEADKVADVCDLCEKLSRSRDDLLTAIRNEIGADPDSTGEPKRLSKKELVALLEILSRSDRVRNQQTAGRQNTGGGE